MKRNYFDVSVSATTSNISINNNNNNKSLATTNKYDDLQLPIGEDLKKLLRPNGLHGKEKEELFRKHVNKFPKWRWEMQNGFSILLQGFGSKRHLLDLFSHWSQLEENHIWPPATENNIGPRKNHSIFTCICRGYMVEIDINDIIRAIMKDWLCWSEIKIRRERARYRSSLEELCQSIIRTRAKQPLLLILHNIDGMNLRQHQRILGILASCENIYFIASCDHINTEIMWDMRDLDRFDFIYHDCTTYIPHIIETNGFTNPPLIPQSMSISTSSRGIGYILKSLTPNHVLVLKEMTKQQLLNNHGILFHQLLEYCLENFWVSNENTLKHYLREFMDHNLISKKKNIKDGIERYVVNGTKGILEKEVLGFEQNN